MTKNKINYSKGVDALQGDVAKPAVNQANGGEFQPQPNGKVREKVGRNDPCPCGSGKKYKKCHGHPQGVVDGNSGGIETPRREGPRPCKHRPKAKVSPTRVLDANGVTSNFGTFQQGLSADLSKYQAAKEAA